MVPQSRSQKVQTARHKTSTFRKRDSILQVKLKVISVSLNQNTESRTAVDEKNRA